MAGDSLTWVGVPSDYRALTHAALERERGAIQRGEALDVGPVGPGSSLTRYGHLTVGRDVQDPVGAVAQIDRDEDPEGGAVADRQDEGRRLGAWHRDGALQV